jgi:hypothetical protein
MRAFVIRVVLFVLLLLGGVLITFALVATSTKYTAGIEAIFFGLKNEWGSTYERSKDLGKWKSQQGTKALILGTSTAYRNINPEILDSLTGYNWFNLGSSSQSLEISTELLKQVVTDGELDVLLLDIYGGTLNTDAYESTYDWIKNADGRSIETYPLLKASKPDSKLISQFLYRQIKQGLPSKNYFYSEPSNGKYEGKGFVCSNKFAALKSDTCTKRNRVISYTDNLQDIIKICEEKKIKLILNISPELGVSDNIAALPADLRVIEHRDFLMEESSYQWYYDSHHMTCEGSRVYTLLLAEKIREL